MEQRQFRDIIAFKKNPQSQAVAFHARNLEVAEISEEAWSELGASLAKQNNSASEAYLELENWNQEVSPTVKSGKISAAIRALTINVTQICNLKCTYCAAGGDGTYGAPQTKINVERTLPQLKFFLDKIPDGGSFKINFLGGEPLLYPEGLQEIANYITLMTADKNIQKYFSIITNGTLFTDKNIALLKSFQPDITISLDGPPEINDLARPQKDGAGSTEKVIEGLMALAAHRDGLGQITLHGVFNKNNMNLVKAYDFYKSLPADSYGFTYTVDEQDSASSLQFAEQMAAVAQKAFAEGGEETLRKIRFFDEVFNALDEQQQTENFCGAGKSFLMIDAKNNLFTCPWDVGQSQEQVGKDLLLDPEQLNKYAAPLIEKNNCQSCWARYMCGGGCMFVHKKSTGNKNLKDEQFCIRTRRLLTTAILYYNLCRAPASGGQNE